MSTSDAGRRQTFWPPGCGEPGCPGTCRCLPVESQRLRNAMPVPAGRSRTGADLIAAERRRQVEQEGWQSEHDREHGASVLRRAAQAYHLDGGPRNSAVPPDLWPWDDRWWKPKGALRNLVRAGALYQASADVAAPGSLDFEWAERGRDECAQAIDVLLAEVSHHASEPCYCEEPCRPEAPGCGICLERGRCATADASSQPVTP